MRKMKVKYLFKDIFKGTNPQYVEEENENIVFGQRNNTKEGKMSFVDCKYTNNQFWNSRNEEEFLKFGDVIINSLGGGTCGRVGFFDILNKKILTDGIPYILRPKKQNKYLYYVLKSNQTEFENMSIGATNQVSLLAEDLKNYQVEIIDNELSQRKIAEFLDERILEIDNIIQKTKDTIDDYKKIKYSIIFDKITKGMKKSIKLKETGNIHIGKIPSNWSAKKIKYIFEIKKDIAGKEGYNILSITQSGIKIKDVSKNEGQLAANYSNYQLVEAGDFAMNHMDLLTGWVDISKYDGVTSPDYRVFRFINRDINDPKYYLYLMQMCYIGRIFYDLGQGVSNFGRWRLQADKFLNFVVPNPPIKEQKEISNYLERKCNEIDKLITNKEKLIDELKQYKESLIYEYVTGKKEVV